MASFGSRWAWAVAAALAGAAGARADDGGHVARWSTILGVVQPGNAVGTGTGQVQGGGQPWDTLGGSARVDLDTGRIGFRVDGLVFAGGSSIGTPGAVTQVKGTLVCDANGSAGGSSVLVDTPLVALDAQGDARFEGDVGDLPAVCRDEPDLAFLVRVAAGRWIAYGAVLRR